MGKNGIGDGIKHWKYGNDIGNMDFGMGKMGTTSIYDGKNMEIDGTLDEQMGNQWNRSWDKALEIREIWNGKDGILIVII